MCNAKEFETDVIRMGDVGAVIDLVDHSFSEGKAEQTARANIIRQEVFWARYKSLRQRIYGGELHG